MKRPGIFAALLFAISFFLPQPHDLHAAEERLPFELVVKISDPVRLLRLVDALAAGPGHPAGSMPAFLEGALFGTDWIDPGRSAVIGLNLSGPSPSGIAFVPFTRPNPVFQAAYSASAGKDHYILSYPPGQAEIAPETKAGLIRNSGREGDTLLSLVLYPNLLLKNDTVMRWTGMLDAPSSLAEHLSQIERCRIGVDLGEENLDSRIELKAVPGTSLASIFTAQAGIVRLFDYKPGLRINFRSREYDPTGFLDLLRKSLGSAPDGAGPFLSDLELLAGSFTGETAGGVTYSEKGTVFENIFVLKEGAASPDFPEKTYLPWLERTVGKLQTLVPKENSQAPNFERTPDSRIGGVKVVGAMMTSGSGEKVPYRMTATGNLFLIASDDRRLEKLIRVSKSLRGKRMRIPLISVDIDPAGYLEMMRRFSPGFSGRKAFGRTRLSLDLKEGTALARSSVGIKDLPEASARIGKVSAEVVKAPDKRDARETGAPAIEQDARYWRDKGALLSAYGNDRAAIPYLKKAIERDPSMGDAYFLLGVAYGEIGAFTEAIAALDRGIGLQPEQGNYYYARGRVYLLSGDRERSLADFRRAAELGNKDARRYLENP